LRTQLQKSLGSQAVAQLHIRAAEWHRQNGSLLEAIQHASLASDDERVERFIEQNYIEMVSGGEQSWMHA
jgi:ATP/maltotriose-dependent transcriptional regulator MalT